MATGTYRFASFVLDHGRHRLSGPGGEIDLRPKSFDVLALLVERAGLVVTKAEMIEAVWPRVVVTDESIARCVSDVRHALGDDGHAIIRTIPKRGYLLDVPVTRVEDAAPPAAASETDDRLPQAAQAGRRPASVVYVDIRDEVERASRHDAEAALDFYEGALACVSGVFHDFGASVQVAPGEAILGLFGVPLAQEDHVVRACHAALESHARSATVPGLRLKIGIATGSVLFKSLEGLRDPMWTAMGVTVDQARHLGCAAPAGTTLVAGDTWRLALGHVVVSPAEANGIAPGTGRLEGRVPSMTRFQAAALRGLTPFVGREVERAQLERARMLALEGRGQVVAIVGEAGVGKSRLLHEFTHELASRQGWRLLAAAGVSYARSTSYAPVVELLKGCLELDANLGWTDLRDQVMRRLASTQANPPLAAPAILQLLDVPVEEAEWASLDPGERRRRTMEAVRLLLLREARAQPLAIVVEDLHWIDAETQSLLDGLVDRIGPERLLLLVTCRPEYRHGWAGKSCFAQVRLDALPARDLQSMLDTLLGGDPGLASLRPRLAGRGNPLFVEEAVRTLAEEGALEGSRGAYRLARPVEAIRIPPTVQAMLAARVDRLAPGDRRLLETAAVIGMTMPLGLLAAAIGEREEVVLDALDRLQAAELVHQTGLPPDVEHAFRHALIQEAVHEGMLQGRVRELNRRVFESIETLHRERLAEHTERLAHHGFAGELHDRAVPYLRAAGLKAARRSALADARHWLERAIDANDRLPPDASTMERGVDMRLELRGVLYPLGEARALLGRLREAQGIAQRLGDARRLSRVSAFMTSIHTMLGQLDEAVATGESAVAVAREHDDLELRVNASNYLVQARYYRGDYDRVLDLGGTSLALWPDEWIDRLHTGNPAPAPVFNRAFVAASLAHLGRFDESARHEGDAVRLAEPTRNPFTIAVAHVPSATLHPLTGDWPAARRRMERFVAVARTGNIVGLQSTALSASAWVLAELGESGLAANRIDEAMRLVERQAANGIGTLAWARFSLGRACMILGRLAQARGLARDAVEASGSQPGFAAYALHLLAEIESPPREGDVDHAADLHRRSLALAEPRGMRPLMARCHDGLGRLARHRGRGDEAEAHFAEARRLAAYPHDA